MTSNSNHNDQIIACLRTMRETIDKLQELLGSPMEDTMERMYRRRRELLTRLYATGGLDQKGLFGLLDEHETPHQWIGQQVKSGYIEKFPRSQRQGPVRCHPQGRGGPEPAGGGLGADLLHRRDLHDRLGQYRGRRL